MTMRSSHTAGKVATIALLVLLSCAGPAAFARRLPSRSLTGASDGTAAKQPRLRRPYARGVKTQAEDSPPPPAAAAPSGTASSGGSDGGNVAKETKHSSKPNLGAILAASILGVGVLCAGVAWLLVRMCLRITGPPLPPRRPAAGDAGTAAPVPVDLPVIIGQHVTHPDGTIAGAIESESSSSSSSSSSASCCSDCSEQRCCLETETEHA